MQGPTKIRQWTGRGGAPRKWGFMNAFASMHAHWTCSHPHQSAKTGLFPSLPRPLLPLSTRRPIKQSVNCEARCLTTKRRQDTVRTATPRLDRQVPARPGLRHCEPLLHTKDKEKNKKQAVMAGGSEPFPPLTSAADRQLHSENNVARRRRKSSILGSELRVGDTGAPSIATGIAHLNGSAKVCFRPRNLFQPTR
jgi:hypothetical protein